MTWQRKVANYLLRDGTMLVESESDQTVKSAAILSALIIWNISLLAALENLPDNHRSHLSAAQSVSYYSDTLLSLSVTS